MLSVDYGDARVGLAITDELRWTARPLETLRNGGRARICEVLAERARAEDVVLVVVGDPVNSDDSVGPRARTTRAFAGALAAGLARRWAEWEIDGVPPRVVLWDEGGSTQKALDLVRRRGSSARRERGKGGIDRVAAAVILQDWLDHGAPDRLAVEPVPDPETGEHREGRERS